MNGAGGNTILMHAISGSERVLHPGVLQGTAPMRVLVVCYEYPPVGGGGGRVAAEVARGLVRRGHQVRVLTSLAAGLPARETIEGVDIRRVYAGRRALDHCTVPQMAAYVATNSLPALREIRAFRPDVVHTHFAVPSGAVAWFATRFGSTPYVVTAHLGDVPGGVPEQTDHLFPVLKPFTLPIWRSAAAVTAVSPHVAALSHNAYGIRPQVILNAIDMTRATSAPFAPREGALRLVWCGRIQEQKNLGPAIEALARLAGHDWTLDVIGDGPLRADTEGRCTSAGLAGQVRFRGWLPAEDVPAALADADVLFQPSITEGLSLVTIEALREGLAFLASRIPGIEDVVVPGVNGLLCSADEPLSFADALATLIEDRPRVAAMRAASLARAPQFDATRMIDEYEAMLGRVVARKSR